MAKKEPRYLLEVPIHGIADRGKGVGRSAEGMAVFAEGAVPGDVADVRIQKKKGGFAEGVAERIVSPSPDRREPFCQHFNICGGCKWQNLDYAAQLRHKQQVVEDALHRIGKVQVGAFLPILGADAITYYRNKLEFGFSNRVWTEMPPERGELAGPLRTPQGGAGGLGFHKAGFFDKIIDIEHCWLQAEPSNAVRNYARELALRQQLAFYDLRQHQGFLRNLMLRLTTTGELMVLVSFAQPDLERISAYLDGLIERFRTVLTTVVYTVNTKLNDSMFDLDMVTYYGKGYVEERLGDLRFKIGPKSFFQTNTRQGQRLYDVAADFAGLTGHENVYDLYTGTGSIALYLARHCRQVVGIEEVPEAIADAQENMRLNGIGNAVFYAGDVKQVLSPEFTERHGRPDVVITDPPRAGMHEKAVRFLLDLEAPRIVYVSCNPATQARDIQWLSEKYDTLKSQPVDMFPHTHHIENVALLERVR
ncbi:MAG TPA: 23S rRNA (uracil(1939)-C(5))-methyltransferase RlmD [Saprospiraceae bacterium]|nr:23S rRNA (uracil(1939)-C(5))-methyltransferase RlmD [Saprospiraceae bacterium]HNG89613.1 23S rRNA (uracil(1939)-C(5))-methyltransferase RlmD [Saprospiraceae bacterium]